jgi:hypothetical protein
MKLKSGLSLPAMLVTVFVQSVMDETWLQVFQPIWVKQ